MNNKSIVVAILFILFFSINVSAETTIKAEVDKTSITTDEVMTYKLIITSTEKKIPIPELPRFDGFRIISRLQSSSVSLIKKESKVTITYTYILAPDKTGTLEIGPSKIKIKDKILSSDAFEIEVKQGKARLQPKGEPTLPEEIQPDSEQPLIITL